MLYHYQPRKRDKLYAQFVQISFMLWHAIPLSFLLIVEKFFIKEDRPLLWRISAHRITKSFFNFCGIHIKLPKEIPDPQKEVAVYVSNHPTMLDGFIYFAFLGPHITMLSAPADRVAFPFNIFFPKMGIVDVLRDGYDESRSKKANTKKQALDKLVSYLKDHNTSVMIFPEGHVESQNKLHYIHTGAIRVSIRAQKPIIVCTLVGLDKIFVDKGCMRPGTVYVQFEEKMYPPKLSRELPFGIAVKQFANELQEKFLTILPSRHIPDYIKRRDPNIDPRSIGIFVDIDNTIYDGYSQKHFVRYLMDHKKISRFTMLRIAYFLFLEKIGLLTHNQLMQKALSFTKGLKEKDLEEVAEIFFKEQVIPHLFHDMVPPIIDHKEFGHTIIFVSEVIEPLAKQFKQYFKAADLRATVLEKNKEGIFTGNIKRLCKGEEKKQQVMEMVKKYNLDLSQSYAYGDALSDIPMLSSVRYACAVNPEKKLEQEAKKCHWEILH